MIRRCMTRWGRIDVLVCNAGIASSRLLLRTTNQEWATILETNLTGAFHCVKAAGRHMLARREGSIIVISSFAALHGQSGQSAYAATKAGLLGLVKSAAREWGPRNVRINAVLPGWHRTEMSAHAMVEERIVHDHALKRSGDVQAVAQTIYHLARLKDVSGQVWNLDSRIP